MKINKVYKFLATIKHNFLFSLFGFSFVCHQNPSCSRYMAMQIKKNGTIVGSLQGIWRIINCRN